MTKNFDTWNEEKKGLEANQERRFYRAREVWWCKAGVNVGVEIDGKGEGFSRPVLVLKGFNRESFLGVFLTGKKKNGKYYIPLGQVEDRDASVNLSQIRIIDTKRLVNRMIVLDKETFAHIRKAIKDML